MDKQPDDPVAKLGKELAADHTLEKARAGDEPTAEELPQEAAPLPEPEIAEDDADEPQFIGDFDSFDAVREFATEGGGEVGNGDLAVVNGALVRFEAGAFKILVPVLVDEYALPADHTEAFTRQIGELERIVLGAEFESGSLLAGVRDTMLALFKARPKSWSEMSNAEQRELAKQLEGRAKDLIKKVARVVAEGEEISVIGKLESFNVKGGFDLKISAPADEDAVVQLFRMQGHEVIIRSADAERFVAGAPEPKTDPDQPGLFADDEIDPDKVAESVSHFEETHRAPPADDSDLADAGEDDDVEEFVEEATELLADDGVGDYESRSNPDDEPVEEIPESREETDAEIAARLTAGFDEASEEELAAQAGRPGSEPAGDSKPKADYVGPKEPEAVPGESWVDTSKEDDRPRFKHPNGKWYLSAPTAEALEAWRASNAKPKSDDDPFAEPPA